MIKIEIKYNFAIRFVSTIIVNHTPIVIHDLIFYSLFNFTWVTNSPQTFYLYNKPIKHNDNQE